MSLSRSLVRALTLATLATASSLAAPTLPAQSTLSRADVAVGGYQVAAPSPHLLRRDAPPAPYDPTDPSLVQGYGSVVNGVSVDGIGRLQTPIPGQPGFASFCTTQRIGLRVLLTAAHCVTDDATGSLFSTVTEGQVLFRGPGATPGSTLGQFFGVERVVVRPDWLGFSNTDYLWKDIAVVVMEQDLPSWVTTYALHTGATLGQQSTHVGYGTFGTGTGATGFDGRRRWGVNQVDWIPNDPTWYADQMLLADFDNGSAQWDTFCLVGVACDRGTTSEAGAASGDSGGPLFINGRLAGITSFGSYFTAGGAPYVADPARPFNSFGSFGGWAPVSANLDFIASATVPEPGTYALMLTGLAGVGLVARRRRESR